VWESDVIADAAPRLLGRMGSLAASLVVVGGFLIVLTINFHPTVFTQSIPTATFVSIAAPPPDRAQQKSRVLLPRRQLQTTASPQIDDLAPPDAEALRAALACLNPIREKRPPKCVELMRTARPDEFAGPSILPEQFVKKAPMRPANLDGIYSRAEQATLVMPPCTGACIPIGKPPPPPTRSPEEICRAKGIGPCTAPPPPP
jgi:hypothetical protein